MKNFISLSVIRTFIGIFSMTIFFYAGMLSSPEYRKLCGWAILYGFGLSALLTVFFSNRIASYVMRFVWIVSCIDIGIRGFLRLYFGITPGAIEIFSTLFGTSEHESAEFFISQWRIFAFVIGIVITVLLLTWFAEKKLLGYFSPTIDKPRSAKIVSIVFFLLFCLALFNPAMRANNNFLYWAMSYHDYHARMAELESFKKSMVIFPEQLNQIHYFGEDKRTIVFIIGESLTTNNMSLYHYSRQTNPLLEKRKSDLLIFNDVISGGFITAAAIPKLLTAANLQYEDGWKSSPSVLMQAKAVGYKTFWISNQLTFDGVVSAISHQADVQNFDNYGNDISESTFDEVLFPDIKKALQDPSPKKLIIVHLLGSHMHYDLRYPKTYRHFDGKDDVVAQHLKQAGRPDWVISARNQYDNSVLYNDMVIDHILNQLQKHVKQTPAALAYLSDHGQEVGDDRDYTGHSAVDKAGWEIPLIFWSNQPFALNKQVLADRPYQTDRFDSTLLDLLKINSPYYKAEDDILSPNFIVKERNIAGKNYTK